VEVGFCLGNSIFKMPSSTVASTFEFLERQIIYSFVDKQTPSSVAELTDILNENETDIKNSVKNLITHRFKEDKTSIFESLKKYKKTMN
jgi:hypothetical protein